jgi:2-methylcitrate dehydratase PrpD
MLLSLLADRICKVTFESLPREAVETAKNGILDTVGVTLAGAQEKTTAVVTRALRKTAAAGPALIFGSSERLDVLSATLINGVAAHALDFDDCSNTLGGHPSAPILPALWALGGGVSGKAFIAAYAVGVECETKLARAVHFHHYEKGWHPTSTLGTFGSAAACGHLMRLTPEQLANALALAASMASGIKANFGTMTKPFHIGHAARNGLLAASLACEGMTANPDALEHPQGFFAVYNGAGTFDASRILGEWADPYDLADPGIAFKRHPCCGSTHPAADAMLHLRAAHGFSPNDIARIESWTHPRRLAHTNRPDPKSGLDAKFSIQYVLARALMHGLLRLEDFADEAVHDPAARAVMAKVNATADPNAESETDDHFFARVRVTANSGKTFEHYVDRPLGRDREHPMPSGTLVAKFRDCASTALDADSADALVRLVADFDNIAEVAEVLQVLAAGVRANPAIESLDARRGRAYA